MSKIRYGIEIPQSGYVSKVGYGPNGEPEITKDESKACEKFSWIDFKRAQQELQDIRTSHPSARMVVFTVSVKASALPEDQRQSRLAKETATYVTMRDYVNSLSSREVEQLSDSYWRKFKSLEAKILPLLTS